MTNPVLGKKIDPPVPMIDFSSTIWYGAETELLTAHLSAHLSELLKSYPEPNATTLRKMIARRHALKDDEIVVTNGPTSAFHLIAQAFRGSKVLLPLPCLPQVEDAFRLYDCELSFVSISDRTETWALDGVDLCVITSPNMPDGHIISHADMVRVFAQNPGVKFVVNQSYASFTTTNKLKPDNIRTYPNVLMVWSFSQPYGIPGLRIGYITASSNITKGLWEYYIPSSVTSSALEAAKYILIHPAQFTLPIRKWLRSAQELMSKLRQIEQIEVIPSDTTFFLLKLKKGTSSELRHILEEKYHITVGDGNRFRGLDDSYICITARDENDNNLLVEAIAEKVESE